MAFTYDITTSAGQVRLNIGDTVETGAIFTDAEISYFLTQNSNNVGLASVQAVEAMIAELARNPDSKKVGDLQLSYKERTNNLKELLKNLRRSVTKSVSPYAGGISISGKQTYRDNTDLVQPEFSKDMMEYDSQLDTEEDS